ncbi:hypothetical protein ACHAPT_000313 [Fusarium lateritium]
MAGQTVEHSYEAETPHKESIPSLTSAYTADGHLGDAAAFGAFQQDRNAEAEKDRWNYQ